MSSLRSSRSVVELSETSLSLPDALAIVRSGDPRTATTVISRRRAVRRIRSAIQTCSCARNDRSCTPRLKVTADGSLVERIDRAAKELTLPCDTRHAPASEPVRETTEYDNGNVKMTGTYLDGVMHGEWAWYRRDGSLMRTSAFDRGWQVGTWRTYDRTGRLVKETAFD